jgi:hypothetical protein
MEALPPVELMTEALDLLVRVLHLLDEGDAPGEIGAYVDLALQRLSRTLEMSRVSNSIGQTAAGPAL